MVITPELIKEWKAERRKNLAAKRATKMAAMRGLMEDAKGWLRGESRIAMSGVLEALDRGDFDERVKEAILKGGNSCAVLDASKTFKGLLGSPQFCQHWLDGDIHAFGSVSCHWCRSVFERELRSVLVEMSKLQGLKFKLPRNSQYVILSF